MDTIIFGFIILILGLIFIFIGVSLIKSVVKKINSLNSFQKTNLLTIFIFIFVFILLISRYTLLKSIVGSILTLFFIRIGYILYNNSK